MSIRNINDLKDKYQKRVNEMTGEIWKFNRESNKIRAKAFAEELKEYINGKFVFEVGCHEGDVLYEFSKYASKVVSVEFNEEPAMIAKEREYECDAVVEHGDAIQYLQENRDVVPDVFYSWSNEGKMEWWIQQILELRGETSPTIITGISLMPQTGGFDHPYEWTGSGWKNPRQLIEAKRIKGKYGGKFVSATFDTTGPTSIGMFGALIMEGEKNGV